jgi:membrane-bound metal-dependent hydrolase YbcI (DUF457 family)
MFGPQRPLSSGSHAMPLPPAHLFVGAGAAELARGSTDLPAWKVWLVGAFFGVLPDADTGILFLLGADAPHHGVYTHNLVAVGLVAAAVALLAGAAWGMVAGAAYLSHLAADLLREGGTTSVHLLWPLSAEPMAPLAPLFPRVPFDRHNGELALYGTDPIGAIVEQTLIAAGFFALAVVTSALFRRLRARRPAARRNTARQPRR